MLTTEQLSKVSQQLVNGAVQVNQYLRDDYPVYLTGIFANGDLHYYLSFNHLPTNKLNLHHQNLLRSLMGLVSLSYRRLYQKITSNVRHKILGEKVFCQELLMLRVVDSPCFVGQMLHLGVAAEEVPKTTLMNSQEKSSPFDNLGQVGSRLCLLVSTYTQSLTGWYEKLSDLGFDITDERSIKEAVEPIAFRQMIS